MSITLLNKFDQIFFSNDAIIPSGYNEAGIPVTAPACAVPSEIELIGTLLIASCFTMVGCRMPPNLGVIPCSWPSTEPDISLPHVKRRPSASITAEEPSPAARSTPFNVTMPLGAAVEVDEEEEEGGEEEEEEEGEVSLLPSDAADADAVSTAPKSTRVGCRKFLPPHCQTDPS